MALATNLVVIVIQAALFGAMTISPVWGIRLNILNPRLSLVPLLLDPLLNVAHRTFSPREICKLTVSGPSKIVLGNIAANRDVTCPNQRHLVLWRKITRSCKIMKEAYFKGMEWTKTCVSRPVDPRWNPYKFYCQICKANNSIYGKGAREILRHLSTEKRLRKDQRWYEYLVKTDPVTRVKTHQVRG